MSNFLIGVVVGIVCLAFCIGVAVWAWFRPEPYDPETRSGIGDD